jgi:hypothetical protein
MLKAISFHRPFNIELFGLIPRLFEGFECGYGLAKFRPSAKEVATALSTFEPKSLWGVSKIYFLSAQEWIHDSATPNSAYGSAVKQLDIELGMQ